MENNIQIGLFFDHGYYFDSLVFAGKLKTEIKELGEGMALPYSEEKNGPLIFFEKGDQIRLLVYSTHMMITLPNPRDKFFDNSLRLIMDILKKEKIVVTRIGYISTFMLGVQEANLFKNNAFDDNEILLSDEYQLSYYKLVNINNMKVNCWKRYMTEAEKFMVSYDLNTLKEEEQKITYDFIDKFIINCDKYIEQSGVVKLK